MPRLKLYTTADAASLRAIRPPQEIRRFLGLLALAHIYYLFCYFVLGQELREYWALLRPYTFPVVLACFFLPVRSALLLTWVTAPISMALLHLYVGHFPENSSIAAILRVSVENTAMLLMIHAVLSLKDFPWWLALLLGLMTNRLVSSLIITGATIMDASAYESPGRQFLIESIGLLSPCVVLWGAFFKAEGRRMKEEGRRMN